MPQRVGKVDMTSSAQYVKVFAGYRTLHGDLRFAYVETAFAMPDLGDPGRFTLGYACPDTEPFDAITAIKFAEVDDVLSFDSLCLTTLDSSR
ncbi:hypothetical protein DYB28_002493 [Aphanomyces astaci]|uniref:Uncharacterized protein n=1 Tax=Aphanomyces astaci TaxID=112090 RepID=A0A9X8EAA4_APHAT|nr:hypothetical protein DYB28_002493 [Aphanomyces astaci]